MTIRSNWNEFDPATRQWLMDHHGAVIVPRTVAAAINRATAEPVPTDSHGQIRLTDEDVLFIRNRAHSAYAAHGVERFFDAVQPEGARHHPARKNAHRWPHA
ncbi:hypothetical protein [Arthrobacter sp. 92]|uniref:hypothetical protein n=1 Tax=Arthrobacter sp. 92 TaxID=3418175 RepID=UPI003CFFFB5A